jgi:dipeptidyl aminopeptidase/acylaminoacyl peptidase
MKSTLAAAALVLALAAPLGTRAAAQGGIEKIAFNWCFFDYYGFGDYVCDIVTVNPDGSDQRFLTEGSGAAFSSDGTKLAFTLRGTFSMRTAEVSTIDLATAAAADLTGSYTWSIIPDHQAPAWSPDGSRIAFESARDGTLDLYVMSADGSGQTRVTRDVGFRGHPAWSRDGSRIAFDCADDAYSYYDICTIGADGTNFARLTAGAGFNGGAAYSPDGRRIAFTTSRFGGWGSEIALMDVDGTNVVRTGVNGFNPAWSPNGTRFVFESASEVCDSDNCMNNTIGTANADGSDIRFVGIGLRPTWTASPLPHFSVAPIASFVPYQCDAKTLCADTFPSWDDQAGPWPDSGIVEYRWNFGDGTTGTGPDPYHRYGANGTYTVSLTVTDRDGLQTTQRQSVAISW